MWELGQVYRGPFCSNYWSSKGLYRHAYPVSVGVCRKHGVAFGIAALSMSMLMLMLMYLSASGFSITTSALLLVAWLSVWCAGRRLPHLCYLKPAAADAALCVV